MEMEDVVGWHFDPKGCFLVKSAYRVHRDVEARKAHRGASVVAGGSQEGDNFWSKLWKMDCQPKIKHFLWRLSHNTLAVSACS